MLDQLIAGDPAMPRSLNARRPHPVEVRQLHSAMEQELTPRQRRRAEALVLHAAGVEAAEIARALDVHVNTLCAPSAEKNHHPPPGPGILGCAAGYGATAPTHQKT
jgi:hypothetical protein